MEATPAPAAVQAEELSSELEELLKNLKSPTGTVRGEVARALHRMGKEGELALYLTALTKTLQDPASTIRESIALVLGGLGVKAAMAVPALIEALGDEDRDLSRAATDALVNIGKVGVPEVSKALDDPRVNVEAMAVLGRIGAPDAAAAVPALERALDGLLACGGPSAFMAAAALAQASGPRKAGWQRGAAVLRDGFRGAAACQAMGALRFVPTAAAVPALLEELATDDCTVQESVVEALECIGAEALPLLVQAMETSSGRDPRVFGAVAKVFENIGHFSPVAVPMLAQKVMIGGTEQRCAAVRLLAGVGAGARPVLPLLSKLAHDKDEDEKLREAALEALSRIEAA